MAATGRPLFLRHAEVMGTTWRDARVARQVRRRARRKPELEVPGTGRSPPVKSALSDVDSHLDGAVDAGQAEVRHRARQADQVLDGGVGQPVAAEVNPVLGRVRDDALSHLTVVTAPSLRRRGVRR